jgi:hypothetical protein
MFEGAREEKGAREVENRKQKLKFHHRSTLSLLLFINPLTSYRIYSIMFSNSKFCSLFLSLASALQLSLTFRHEL